MTLVTLQRSPFTAAVLEVLRTTGKPVGDGGLPQGGQWQGQPNAPGSRYIPFAVVAELTASRSSGPWADPQGDWQLPYLVEYFGASREQCSRMADLGRTTYQALKLRRFEIDGVEYGVQQLRTDSLGQPIRVDQTEPRTWHAQDGITIWVGKGK